MAQNNNNSYSGTCPKSPQKVRQQYKELLKLTKLTKQIILKMEKVMASTTRERAELNRGQVEVLDIMKSSFEVDSAGRLT